MSFNASELFDQVDGALAAAGTSQELVFAAVAEAITEAFEGPPPPGLQAQVYVLAVLLGVELLVVLASIGLRVWLGRRSCWLFERRQTRLGTYIVPNASFTCVPV